MSSNKPSSKGRRERPEGKSAEANSNPFDRQRSFLKQRYAVLRSADSQPTPPAAHLPEAPAKGGPLAAANIDVSPAEMSALENAGGILPPDFRLRITALYRQRQQQQQQGRRANAEGARMSPPGRLPQSPRHVSAFVAGEQAAGAPLPARSWIPIGPSVLRQGQAVNRPATSGRVAGLAIAPGGLRVYVASANGGVWRSDDGGHTWRSTMDAWDLNPTTVASDSLACGAIALDPLDPDRVYVGTGEGGGDAYFGVGPIRSDDGGENWITEPTAPGTAAELAGTGFYRLAVDPSDRERVVGATEVGLYRREPDGRGGYHWAEKQSGNFSSVVVARNPNTNLTTYYAARRDGNVLMSTDGNRWITVGADFPRDDVGRIGLAVQPDNPNVVYALVANLQTAHLLGVWRLDRGDDRWREVRDTPSDLFGSDPDEDGQGWYDLAIAVDPNNINRIYLGGSSKDVEDIMPSSVYACLVTSHGSGRRLTYKMVARYIGANVHADIHALEFTPGDSNRLWVGCDGGVFYTKNATGAASFDSRNVGLSTLTMNHLTMHPTEEAFLFCGTQDNGTSRYTGEEVWLHSCWGDGGYGVINWNEPLRVLRTYINGYMQRAGDGGQSYDSWEDAGLPKGHVDKGEFYSPLVGTPRNTDAPAEAETVAFGGRRLWLSNSFGSRWRSLPSNDTDVADDESTDALPGSNEETENNFLSLVFASASRIYGGTTLGEVYRYDKTGTRWTRTRIDAAPLPSGGPITCIVVDAADQSGASIYLTLGGRGDYRHVWHYDGEAWQGRGGPVPGSDQSLLDIQHNAIVVDPAHPTHLYTGADIGIWRSTDGGEHWETFSEGLPDAAVLDLALHPERRLLWAATHGRGVYEYDLDGPGAPAVQLYLRDTQLDTGRRTSVEGTPDPTRPGKKVKLGQSPDIKLDAPSRTGAYQTPTNQIDFYQFVDEIKHDDSLRVVTTDPANGIAVNRVYVMVHTRGRTPAREVQVMLLLARRSGDKPLRLPPGYSAKVRAGHQINTPQWRTVGMQTIREVRGGLPPVAAFDLPSNILPSPAELEGNADHCLLALLHAVSDPFTNDEIDIVALTAGERKAVFKDLRVVAH
ncbi:MAG TPA: hypothetical protein VF735_01970 [Pyrinomonadaceae bacterium]|jgi:hypothetical protein